MQIRLAAATDGDSMAAIYAPIVASTSISFETESPGGGEMAKRISATLPRYPWLVAEDSWHAAGFAYAGPHRTRAAYRWATEVSVYVATGSRRRGVARRLYGALLELLDAQGFRAAYAGITQPNPASVAFHESVGFTPVGVYRSAGWKDGAWHDVGWWQLVLGDGSPPDEVATLDAVPVDTILNRWTGQPPAFRPGGRCAIRFAPQGDAANRLPGRVGSPPDASPAPRALPPGSW